MFPTTPVIFRRAGLVAALAAVTLPAGAHAAPAVSVTAHAHASVALMARAQASTATAERLAATSSVLSRQALDRSQAQLRRAAALAADVAANGDAALAGSVSARFATVVKADAGTLAGLVERTRGQLETAAGQAIRADVTLAAKVGASVAERSDLETDAALSLSVARTDAASVALIGRLQASLDTDELGARVRGLLSQAVGAGMAVRTAIAARVQALADRLQSAAMQELADTADALAKGSASLAANGPLGVPVSVDADANATVGLPGVSVVASIVAHLRGGTASVRSSARAR